jgi:hypothetical protein
MVNYVYRLNEPYRSTVRVKAFASYPFGSINLQEFLRLDP